MRNILLIFYTAIIMSASATSHALYDPAPVASMATLEGAWRGSLQYRDYQPPFGKVTLPTQLYAALLSPNELALHYVFDDGPGKIIHSYDRLKIDLSAKTVTFTAAKAGETIAAKVVSSNETTGTLEIVAETVNPKSTMRYTLRLSAAEIVILKEEAGGITNNTNADKPINKFEFRSKYSFTRTAK